MSDNSVNTESKILEAAANEFMTKGYAGARTTAIAEAAGVTHGMLHYYFRTKEKLFERIISDRIELLTSIIAGSIESTDSDIYKLLHKITHSHLDFLAENPLLPGFLIREVYGQPEWRELLIRKFMAFAPIFISQLQTIINQNAAEGKCRAIDAKMLILDMVSLNVFPFMAAPLISTFMPNAMQLSPDFLEARKQQNYETLVSKLRI